MTGLADDDGFKIYIQDCFSSGSGVRGAQGTIALPVKISHKKDGCRRLTYRFHVSRPLPFRTRPLDPVLHAVLPGFRPLIPGCLKLKRKMYSSIKLLPVGFELTIHGM